jgi:hypothetical protein
MEGSVEQVSLARADLESWLEEFLEGKTTVLGKP